MIMTLDGTDRNPSPKVGFDWILAMALLLNYPGPSQSKSGITLSIGIHLGVVQLGGPLMILLKILSFLLD